MAWVKGCKFYMSRASRQPTAIDIGGARLELTTGLIVPPENDVLLRPGRLKFTSLGGLSCTIHATQANIGTSSPHLDACLCFSKEVDKYTGRPFARSLD